ncbi:hypothetical protein R1flu_021288 [Riccia fluitans]|uniref:Arginase n=1 Tax=Riccia fluitans TaxID=41844 RepID=A0ABD1ZNX6_9MARC
MRYRSRIVLGAGLDFEQGQPDLIAKLPVDFMNLSNQYAPGQAQYKTFLLFSCVFRYRSIIRSDLLHVH